MKAQNLTISIPCSKCDKNCPYCISTITWQPANDIHLMAANLPKIKRVADRSDVTNIMITSKKEPFMNLGETLHFARHFKDYWLEIQTNGIYLNAHASERGEELVKDLFRSGVNVIAFSIDKLSDLDKYAETFELIASYGIIIRVCVNLTKIITRRYGFYNVMEEVTKRKDKTGVPFIRQVLFRNINYPTTAPKDHSAVKWIDENVSMDDYMTLYRQMDRAGLKELRTIPHTGLIIYSCESVSICFSDYCLQESNETEDIRSLIFHSDGHLYTSWDDPASILF